MHNQLALCLELAILYAIKLGNLLWYNCLTILHAGRPFLCAPRLFGRVAAEAGFEGRLLHGYIVGVAASLLLLRLVSFLRDLMLSVSLGHG